MYRKLGNKFYFMEISPRWKNKIPTMFLGNVFTMVGKIYNSKIINRTNIKITLSWPCYNQNTVK